MTDCGRILVVDDYVMNRMKLSHFLRQQGHEVTLAENGKQAVERLASEAFDLMLLDIEMPEMDGYQVLEYMKQHDLLRNLPVIVISASEEMERVITCITMGAEDYLPKPFDPVLLNARIGACLEKKRLRDKELEYLRQVRCLTDAAAAVEAETFHSDCLEPVAGRADELGQLARVFQRMVREVYAREQRLKQQVQELRIELNEARQQSQITEITETEYFRELKNEAHDLRSMIEEVIEGG